ncbi:MAG: antitoxin Xre/MbcA/ParS toxin-binding domain-containing protein [Gallionella sp.]
MRANKLSSSEKYATATAAEPARARGMVAEPNVAYQVRARTEPAIVASLLNQTGIVSDMAMVNLIHQRIPLDVLDRLAEQGVTKQELNLVAPARTLAHRRANSEPLTIDESDRAVRLVRVLAQAEVVFGAAEKSMTWLRHPLKRFEGKTPLEMLATDVGSRLVEEALVQIDEGFYA